MIFDRTYQDIVNAKKIYLEKVQSPNFNGHFSESEQKIIDRAFLNSKALNRITTKMREMWAKIYLLGGEIVDCDELYENWTEKNFFTKNNFENIIENIEEIRKTIIQLIVSGNLKIDDSAFNGFASVYGKIDGKYTYVCLNAIEESLYLLNMIVTNWVVKVNDILYIYNAYNSVFEDEVLEIT